MENYADYSFYLEEYKGSLSDSLFSVLIIKASRIIDKNVNRELTESVINNLSDRDNWRLKYVACELCDYLNENGSASSSGGASSISIDGVSINKSNKTYDEKSKSKKEILAELPHCLTRYL